MVKYWNKICLVFVILVLISCLNSVNLKKILSFFFFKYINNLFLLPSNKLFYDNTRHLCCQVMLHVIRKLLTILKLYTKLFISHLVSLLSTEIIHCYGNNECSLLGNISFYCNNRISNYSSWWPLYVSDTIFYIYKYIIMKN